MHAEVEQVFACEGLEEGFFQAVMEFRAAHRFVGGQVKTEDLTGRHVAHFRVMFRDVAGLRHAGVVNHHRLVTPVRAMKQRSCAAQCEQAKTDEKTRHP